MSNFCNFGQNLYDFNLFRKTVPNLALNFCARPGLVHNWAQNLRPGPARAVHSPALCGGPVVSLCVMLWVTESFP